jgi:hypothetical protein
MDRCAPLFAISHPEYPTLIDTKCNPEACHFSEIGLAVLAYLIHLRNNLHVICEAEANDQTVAALSATLGGHEGFLGKDLMTREDALAGIEELKEFSKKKIWEVFVEYKLIGSK